MAMEMQEFDRLEAKIDDLLTKFASLLKKNEELLQIIAEKDGNIAKLELRLSEMTQEKETVSHRIGELLNKFESLKQY